MDMNKQENLLKYFVHLLNLYFVYSKEFLTKT